MTRTIMILSALLCVSQSAPAQDDPAWSTSAAISYLNRYNAYGIDLAETGAASLSLDVSHASGFSAGVAAIRTMGAGGELQNWSASLGYELTLAELLTLSAEFTHYQHSNDTANVLAALANSVAVGAELDFGIFSAGVSYDAYLGSNAANYFGFNVSSFLDVGPVYVVPLIQATMMSQEVEERFLKSGGGSGSGSGSGGGSSTTTTTSTVTGLSSISLHAVVIVPIVSGLSLSVHPYYLYSPKSEVSTESSRFMWTAGMRYSVEW